VYVAGDSRIPSQFYEDIVTVAYDSGTGAQLWAARLDDGPGESIDTAHDVAVSPDGARVYVTGDLGDGAVTVAYDASSGTMLWQDLYYGPISPTWASALAVDPTGTFVYVTGTIHNGYADYVTLAYDAHTGARKWKRSYDGPTGQDDYGQDVAVDAAGTTVFVTGTSLSIGVECATVAYDARTGRQRWVRGVGARRAVGGCLRVAVGPDDSMVFVSGDGAYQDGDSDFVTLGLDSSTGRPRWLGRYEGPANGQDLVVDNAVSADGGAVYVTGTGAGQDTGTDLVLAAFDAATGASLWVATYDGPQPGADFDWAVAVDVSPVTGDAYVVGTLQTGDTDSDYGTLAYSPSGTLLWAETYDNPLGGYDDGDAVAVSPTSATVFVTGRLNGYYQTYIGTTAYPA
jgi:outer membrane protein assembly factor BamB